MNIVHRSQRPVQTTGDMVGRHGEIWGGMGSSQRPVQTPQAEQALRRAAETACLQRLPEVTRDPPRLQALRWAAETSVQTLSQPLLAAAPPPPAGYAAGHLSPSLPISPRISPYLSMPHTHTPLTHAHRTLHFECRGAPVV